jgi:hypothetical protein
VVTPSRAPSATELAFRDAWPARCDRAALARLRRRCATGEALADLATLDAIQARRDAARLYAQLAAIEAQQASRGDVGDVMARASRYLAMLDVGPGDAWRAALHMVRGFGLGEAAMSLLASEYAPRYHRKLHHNELAGMVRRAMRASKPPWGCHLAKGS